ncbi:hypothetical protein WA158_002100 [Blastocystis sp. Blastoise]
MAVYGKDIWDPFLIVFQIAALQSWFYFFWTLAHAFVVFVLHMVNYPIIDILFGDWFYMFEISGYIISVELFFSCNMIAVIAVNIVERSKKILDFISTMFIIHLLLCWYFHGIPDNWSWWIIFFVSFLYTTYTAETFCIHRELEDIYVQDIEQRPVHITIPNHNDDTPNTNIHNQEDEEDQHIVIIKKTKKDEKSPININLSPKIPN